MKDYDTVIDERLNTQDVNLPMDEVFTDRWNSLSSDATKEDDTFIEELRRVIDDVTLPHEDDIKSINGTIPDTYVNMEVALPHGTDNELVYATVKHRAVDDQGNQIGKYHSNPLLDSRLYEVEYVNGSTEALTANIIADSIMSQVDEEGHKQLLLKDIIDHRVDGTAMKHEDSLYVSGDTKRRKGITRGWQICVK